MPVRSAEHTSCGDSILTSSVLSLKKRLWHSSRMPGRNCIALHSCCASSIVKPQMLSYFMSREMSVSHSSDPPTGDSAIGVSPTTIMNEINSLSALSMSNSADSCAFLLMKPPEVESNGLS